MKQLRMAVWLLVCLVVMAVGATASVEGAGAQPAQKSLYDSFGNVPLYFVKNDGQLDARVAYYVQGRDTTVYFTPEGVTIAVDGAGSAYVTGVTISWDKTFPVKVGPDLTLSGYSDAFVAKVNADGTALDYAGYIGGFSNEEIDDTEWESGKGIAVDGAGNAYVTGLARSSLDFPATVGPDLTLNGGLDGFVAKVSPAGAFVYAGYIGGAGANLGFGIAVDGAGNAYVTGLARSSQASFPVTGGPDLSHNGDADAFVTKVRSPREVVPPNGILDQNLNLAADEAVSVGSGGTIDGKINGDPSNSLAIGPGATVSGNVEGVGEITYEDGAIQDGNLIGIGSVTVIGTVTMTGNVETANLDLGEDAHVTIERNLRFTSSKLVLGRLSSLTVMRNVECTPGMTADIGFVATVTILGKKSSDCPF